MPKTVAWGSMKNPLASFAQAIADRYTLGREIGQGGMATVYLARDLRHDRDVAIKVLKPELGAVLGVERFLSEIKVTANLQHPHLLPLFDSGEADGLLFYVMPYVEGETLRARLEREKQLPVEEAVRLAVAIAQALDYAHRRGVIHRDLKPENILLPDGQPLVADFGIALAVSKAGGQRVTQTGLSLGTPQYMSPEQATGDRAVDARTDIYSLGAITYEMLTGEPPHSGSTAQAIIARLMTEDVRPLSVLRRSVPPHVDAAVRHALEKLAADRFASAGEFAQALQGKGESAALSRYLTSTNAPAVQPRAAGSRARELAAYGIAALALFAFGWSRLRKPELAESPVIRASIDLPTGEELMLGRFPIVLSPQGDQMAYITQSASGYRTILRRTSELSARTVLAQSTLRNVTFSPDGRWIAYTEGLEVRRVPTAGGEHETLGSVAVDVIEGLAWTETDVLVVGTGQGLFTLPARGGAPKPLADSVNVLGLRYPWAMPDGNRVIARGGQQLEGQLVAVDLESGRQTDLAMAGDRAHGIVDGHLVFQTRAGVLSAVPFDAAKLRTTGDPFVIESDARGVGLSASGTLAFLSGATERLLVLRGREGETVLRDVPASYSTPRFSPDGRRVAVAVATADGSDIWVFDRSANTFTRITTADVNTAPEWTSDGRRILYKEAGGDGTRMMLTAADGSTAPEELFSNGFIWNEGILSADERWLIVRTAPDNVASRDIFAVDLKGDRKLQPLVTGPTSETMPRLSPDGRWLAYQSDVSGRFEVYVRPFPEEGARAQVSDAGGTEPIWSRDGRTLFYRGAQGIVATSVTSGSAFTVGARRLAMPSTEPPDPTHASYDVAPDGSGFLFSRPAGGQVTAVVIHNWRREFRERQQRATSTRAP